MPKPRRKFIGMGRTFLEGLGDAGLIEVIRVQRPGCTRGVKLIYLPSLFSYLDRLRAAQAAKFTNPTASGRKETIPA